jgi:hypothetical protein
MKTFRPNDSHARARSSLCLHARNPKRFCAPYKVPTSFYSKKKKKSPDQLHAIDRGDVGTESVCSNLCCWPVHVNFTCMHVVRKHVYSHTHAHMQLEARII